MTFAVGDKITFTVNGDRQQYELVNHTRAGLIFRNNNFTSDWIFRVLDKSVPDTFDAGTAYCQRILGYSAQGNGACYFPTLKFLEDYNKVIRALVKDVYAAGGDVEYTSVADHTEIEDCRRIKHRYCIDPAGTVKDIYGVPVYVTSNPHGTLVRWPGVLPWCSILSSQQEVHMNINDIKTRNKKEAKKQFDNEKKNAEIEYAKSELRRATDAINNLDEAITKLEKQREPYQEILKAFK